MLVLCENVSIFTNISFVFTYYLYGNVYILYIITTRLLCQGKYFKYLFMLTETGIQIKKEIGALI